MLGSVLILGKRFGRCAPHDVRRAPGARTRRHRRTALSRPRAQGRVARRAHARERHRDLHIRLGRQRAAAPPFTHGRRVHLDRTHLRRAPRKLSAAGAPLRGLRSHSAITRRPRGATLCSQVLARGVHVDTLMFTQSCVGAIAMLVACSVGGTLSPGVGLAISRPEISLVLVLWAGVLTAGARTAAPRRYILLSSLLLSAQAPRCCSPSSASTPPSQRWCSRPSARCDLQ